MRLTNFQGHRSSFLEFAPGVNVITGESDIGKSSIMRALVWLVTNRPSGAGEKWVWWGAEKNDIVNVCVGLGNGEAVARFRKGSKNGYEIDTGDGPVELVAIRTDVPTEVSDLLNLGEHNLQSQHLGYFLLADTPGEVARKLNAVCGLDIIDSCLKNANSFIVENSRDITQYQHKASELASLLHDLEYVDGFEQSVLQAEGFAAERDGLSEIKQRMENALVDVKEADDTIAELEEFLVVEPQILELLALFEERDRLVVVVEYLGGLHDSIDGLDRQIEQSVQAVAEAQKEFDDALVELGLCPMCGREV